MRKYECFAVKERGFNHIKNNLACQDSSDCLCDGSLRLIAVADGHGSAQYFRSDRGSDFAVRCAIEKLQEFTASLTADDLESEKEWNDRIGQLIKSIITEWHKCVENDYMNDPFEVAELEKVPEKYRVIYEKKEKIERAYGTTLIAVADNGEYSVGIHIGDGKCVSIYEDGSADEPIPWDDKCHLNQCTSICDPKAADEFRFYIWNKKRPVAVIICSDGIDDSYGSFLHDYCKSVLLDLTDGEFTENVGKLKNSLPNVSQNGSRDDVSIAGLIDINKIDEIRPLLDTDIKLARVEKEIIDANNKKNDLIFLCGKAERIYEKCKASNPTEAELNDKKSKYNDLKKELDEVTGTIFECEKRRSELLAHRQSCISGQHSAKAVCPECGHELEIHLETSVKGENNE